MHKQEEEGHLLLLARLPAPFSPVSRTTPAFYNPPSGAPRGTPLSASAGRRARVHRRRWEVDQSKDEIAVKRPKAEREEQILTTSNGEEEARMYDEIEALYKMRVSSPQLLSQWTVSKYRNASPNACDPRCVPLTEEALEEHTRRHSD